MFIFSTRSARLMILPPFPTRRSSDLIFSVDNRGTPGRDRKFQTAIRHEFGAVELKDQLTALDQLLAQYPRSEEHTSELQSRFDLVCRLLLEKKKDVRRPDLFRAMAVR